MIKKSEEEIRKNWKKEFKEPILSICCITYKHEKFIAMALDSFLMQETDFPFEILVSDDCSPDNTATIIKEYIEKFPNIINPCLRSKNVGMITNGLENLKRAKGKYIALCEGDDYWTDINKLQIQVDFLNNNLDYVVSTHDAFTVDENENKLNTTRVPAEFKKDFSAENLILSKAWLATACSVFKNVVPFHDILEMNMIENGDTFLWSVLGQYGKSKYHEDILPAAYHMHTGGICSMQSKTIHQNMQTNTLFWLYRYYFRIGKKDYADYYLLLFNSVVIQKTDWKSLLKESIVQVFHIREIKKRLFYKG